MASSTPESTRGQTAPRWQRRKDARPAEIVSAALDEFVERGFAATKLEDVARRAGITKGTMYLYFENKEELFKAAVRESLVATIAAGERIVEEFEGPSAELFAVLVRRWWAVLGESRISGIPKLMIAEASNFPDLARFYLEEVIQRGSRLLASALQRGIDRGEFRPIDVAYAVRLAIAPVMHATLWRHSFQNCGGDALDGRAFIESHIDLFLRGISNHRPGEETP